MPLPPQVLENQALSLVEQMGYSAPIDQASGFGRNTGYLRWIEEHDASLDRWDRLDIESPASVVFWMRQSTQLLDPDSFSGRVNYYDPPLEPVGSIRLHTSPTGQLIHFEAVPPMWDVEAAREPFDWSILFASSGLESSALSPVEPRRIPPRPYFERSAWSGVFPEAPDIALRVEAASLNGRPVYYEVLPEWNWAPELAEAVTADSSAGESAAGVQESAPSSVTEGSSSRADRRESILRFLARAGGVLGELMEPLVFLSAIVVGWRSARSGRGDRRGAARVAAFFVVIGLILWATRAHHTGDVPFEFASFFYSARNGVFQVGVIWLLYLALEPHVRRTWPDCLVAWNRLLAGRFGDARVGREALYGVFMGLCIVASDPIARWIGIQAGMAPPRPESPDFAYFAGLRATLAGFLASASGGVLVAFAAVFLLVILRWVVRWRPLAIAVFVLVAFFVNTDVVPTGLVATEVGQRALGALLLGWFVLRQGLLALAVGTATVVFLGGFPLTTSWSHWSENPRPSFSWVLPSRSRSWRTRPRGHARWPDGAASDSARGPRLRPMKRPNGFTYGVFLIASANFLAGGSYPAQKLALEALPAATISVIRNLIAIAAMLVYVRLVPARGSSIEAGPERWRVLFMGIVAYGLPMLLGIVGVRYSTSSNGSILILLEPVMIVFLAWLLLRERIPLAKLIAIVIGLWGALVVVLDGGALAELGASEHSFGNLLLALHGILWGLYTPLAKPLIDRGRDPFEITLLSLVYSLVLLVPMACLEWDAWSVGAGTWSALGWCAALGIGCSFIATVFWAACLRYLPASTVAPFVFLQPIAGVGAGVLFLRESLPRASIVGGAIIAAAVLLTVWADTRRSPV